MEGQTSILYVNKNMFSMWNAGLSFYDTIERLSTKNTAHIGTSAYSDA